MKLFIFCFVAVFMVSCSRNIKYFYVNDISKIFYGTFNEKKNVPFIIVYINKKYWKNIEKSNNNSLYINFGNKYINAGYMENRSSINELDEGCYDCFGQNLSMRFIIDDNARKYFVKDNDENNLRYCIYIISKPYLGLNDYRSNCMEL